MTLSKREKNKMKELSTELQDSIMEIAKDRKIKIDRDELTEFEVVEKKFNIRAKKPLFPFGWLKSKRGWQLKNFVSEKKLEKRKRELENYIGKYDKN
jgi:hypothetical protein